MDPPFIPYQRWCGWLMVNCPDDMTTWPKAILSTQRRFHGGTICTSFKHCFTPLWQQNIACMYPFGLVSQQVGHWCNIGCCVHGGGKGEDVFSVQCDDNTSFTNWVIGINRKKDTLVLTT